MKIEDYNEYYIQGSDHYLIPKDVFKELFNEMINWKEESNKKKEVIDELKEYIWRTEINSIGTPLAYVTIGKELLDILKEAE